MEIQKRHRPFLVEMFCSFYFVYWAISIIGLVAALLMNIGPQFPAFSIIANRINLIFLGAQAETSFVTWLIAAGLAAGVIGYWLFQKWSVVVYTASSIALSIVVLSTITGTPTKIAYIGTVLYLLAAVFAVNIAMIVVGIIYFTRMK